MNAFFVDFFAFIVTTQVWPLSYPSPQTNATLRRRRMIRQTSQHEWFLKELNREEKGKSLHGRGEWGGVTDRGRESIAASVRQNHVVVASHNIESAAAFNNISYSYFLPRGFLVNFFHGNVRIWVNDCEDLAGGASLGGGRKIFMVGSQPI